jgi:hypothetical protein
VCGFTAGGSGTVSTEAIAISAPRTQVRYGFDFIPACAPNINPAAQRQCRCVHRPCVHKPRYWGAKRAWKSANRSRLLTYSPIYAF